MRQRFALPNLPAVGDLAAAAESNEGRLNPSGRIAPILSMARRVSRPPKRAGAPFIWNMVLSHPVLPAEASRESVNKLPSPHTTVLCWPHKCGVPTAAGTLHLC